MQIVWNAFGLVSNLSITVNLSQPFIYVLFLLGGDEKACRSIERCEHNTLLQPV